MQTPKSILLHLDGSARTAERIALARRLAEAFDAQVTGAPCTLSTLMRYPFALEGAAEAVAIMREGDKAAWQRMYASFTAQAAGSPRMHWTEQERDAPWGFARRALYADLVILGQRNPEDPMASELPGDFLPHLLVESGRPALVLPYAGPLVAVPGTVLLAWKETPEAARAVSAALPWLRAASKVHAACYGEGAEASLKQLQRYLAAQGIADVSLHADGTGEGDAGNRLLSMAADLGADLLVMGCYGHGRAREWILGGATRTMLASMTLPVLMSH
ncbi:nucleotide-binding universal stress UspA family protein [Variovorax beijingensis]|uniref:Nucleotide-binding universal stress UspA family protein n=1 Tax=Variovorax beijingensis TaxID=2496117 RepID=A0A561C370_9BURK|nr:MULTISPECIES: universal stress protein [Variovorax]MDP9964470.1 nucleotide-binding universal stress UspA family protein [Variovorax paradoxus]TWD85649.1 nucleotide-binding universal stress UspA family protein [Variovorax beijingensis]